MTERVLLLFIRSCIYTVPCCFKPIITTTIFPSFAMWGSLLVWHSGVDNPPNYGYTYPKKEVNPMKKDKIFALLYQLASPVLLIVLGAILLFRPDTASALIARLLGWVLTLVGIGFGISALVSRDGLAGKVLGAIVCAVIGGWLTANPLLLAAGIGRFLGILVAIRGIRDVFQSRSRGHGQILAIVTTVVGVLLTVLPMTTSRLVFSICGVVILVIGIAMLLDRLKDRRLLDDGDSNIIDAL